MDKPKFQLLDFKLDVYENVTDFPQIELDSKFVSLESGRQIAEINYENLKKELIEIFKNNIKIKEV